MIQIPASYMKANGEKNIGAAEKNYALVALIFCLVGFVSYLVYQVRLANSGENDAQKMRRDAAIKQAIRDKKISIKGAMAGFLTEASGHRRQSTNNSYSAINTNGGPAESEMVQLAGILKPFFHKFDVSNDGKLDMTEIAGVLNDLGETSTAESSKKIFSQFDTDKSGFVEFGEFVQGMYSYIVENDDKVWKADSNDGDDEDEEMPEEIAALPADQQQKAIKKKAFGMLILGTCLVLTFR